MANILKADAGYRNHENQNLVSTLEYKIDSNGAANRSIVLPRSYDRPREVEALMSYPEIVKAGVDMGAIEKELQINKDLLKTSGGYLDVCKGILDSLKAVKIGDCRFAQNILNSNKVVFGSSSAKKGREFLLRDHGIDLDEVQPSTERFRLISTERKLIQRDPLAEEDCEAAFESNVTYPLNPYLNIREQLSAVKIPQSLQEQKPTNIEGNRPHTVESSIEISVNCFLPTDKNQPMTDDAGLIKKAQVA